MEYEKAQDSAEHHDNLLWTVTGLIGGGMAALFGFVLGKQPQELPKLLGIYAASMGIAMTVSVGLFVHSFASYRNQKYARCKDIEKLLGMNQHSGLRDPKPAQRHVVYLLFLLFFVGWAFLLCNALRR
ncbi:MAG: hypothetical protein ACHQLQ_15085 [Candidatus Acidiferrales bacterium]